MRNIDICLGRRPTQIDLCLGRRVVQCDLIVCNIPYQDSISADEAIVLQDCLRSYVLLKFVAAQSGSELVSHIDGMIEFVCERMSSAIEIGSSVGLSAMVETSVSPNELVIGAGDLQTLAVTAERVQSAIELAVQDIALDLSKPVDPAELGMELTSGIGALTELVDEGAAGQIDIGAYLAEEKQQFEQAASTLETGAELGQLLRQMGAVILYQLVIDSYLADILLEKVLQGADLPLELEIGIVDGGVRSNKFERAVSAMELCVELAMVVGKVVAPDRSELEIGGAVNILRARYRLLSDMDDHDLSGYDDMTMTEVDFIFLD